MNDNQLITIIVPVYNAANALSRGIESIINQSYTYWELILINDGSLDNSGEICDEYAKKDRRIKVFHSLNQGVSVARNRGIDNASGEWITFLDSDDWIEPYHLQTFYDQIKSGVDLGINSFIIDLKYVSRNIHLYECSTTNNAESINYFFGRLQLHSQFIWNKIFRRSILSEYTIRFNIDICLGEDNIFLLEYLKYVDRLSSVGVPTYHYDQQDENPDSLGRKQRSRVEFETLISANCKALLSLYYKCNEPLILHHASNYYFTRVFERIITKERRININDQIEYIKLFPILHIDYIKDSIIKRYWNNVRSRGVISCLYILNLYKFKLWLKSKILDAVAVVKRVRKFAQKRA